MLSALQNMSGFDVGTLFEKGKELDQLRKDQDDVLAEINKIYKKIQASPDVLEKSGDSVLLKLRSLYVNAKELAEAEASASALLLNQLETLQQSGTAGSQRKKIEVNEQKKKRMKSDPDMSRVPPTSIRTQLDHAASLKGEQVAARVPSEDDTTQWVVVKVIHFDRETKEFEVLDEEPGDDEGSVQKKYKLPMSQIIPFPKRNDPSGTPDFHPGRHVLAVYPGTTALYKATVVNSHRKRKTDDYLLEFDDDEEDGCLPQRMVPFHRVVTLPDGYCQ